VKFLLYRILPQMGIIMKQKSSKGMLLVSGYAILTILSIMAVFKPEQFTPFTTPKLENTSPQSIVSPSVLV
jgi:hypothetical protein